MSIQSQPRPLNFAFLRMAFRLACVSPLWMANPANAVLVTGRFSTGGYISRENFSDVSQGSTSNDFETLSSRLYLNLQRLGEFTATIDLRDKHDFFDRLDAERLQLKGSNTLQVREADVKYPNKNGPLYLSLGRFSLIEAGSVYVDGLEVGNRFTPSFRIGGFAGHNPKRPEDMYMRNDTPDFEYGGYLNYQPTRATWKKFFSASAALVTNTVKGFTDRRYFYSNTLYQWNSTSRIISNLYVDFVPKTILQNGILVYQQGITNNLDTTVQLTAWDAIEYSRRKSVLETLPSSPYRDLSVETRYRFNGHSAWLNQARWGQRLADHKQRDDLKTGLRIGDLVSNRVDILGYAGYRQEFISRGPMANFEINYYSRKWEYGLSIDSSIQSKFEGETVAPSVLHQITTQINLAHVFSNSLFTTVTLQYDHDEVVSIISGFITLTYRFGNQDLAPIRDGAPPRRSL